MMAQGAVGLLTLSQRRELHKNFLENNALIQKDGETVDFKPVVKLFTPDGSFIWLLTELAPDGIAFGLADLGHGMPEMGYIDFGELESFRGQYGLPIERDMSFVADKTLSEYACLARKQEKIIA